MGALFFSFFLGGGGRGFALPGWKKSPDFRSSEVVTSVGGRRVLALTTATSLHPKTFFVTFCSFRSCSIGIHHFNHNPHDVCRLKELRFPKRTLFQLLSVETPGNIKSLQKTTLAGSRLHKR